MILLPIFAHDGGLAPKDAVQAAEAPVTFVAVRVTYAGCDRFVSVAIAVTGLVVPEAKYGMVTVALDWLEVAMLLMPRVSCIVRFVWPGAEARVAGLQETVDVWAGTLMTALVVVTAIPIPAALTATAFEKAKLIVVAAEARVMFMFAAIPDPIVLSFVPISRQVTEPDPGAQVTNLPAETATGPGVTETLAI